MVLLVIIPGFTIMRKLKTQYNFEYNIQRKSKFAFIVAEVFCLIFHAFTFNYSNSDQFEFVYMYTALRS